MKRTVSTPHLVLGIIFAGIATVWFVGAATDASFHDTAPGFPLVLIGAGLIGLVASVTNSRNRRQAVATHEAPADQDRPEEHGTATAADAEPTTVIEENN